MQSMRTLTNGIFLAVFVIAIWGCHNQTEENRTNDVAEVEISNEEVEQISENKSTTIHYNLPTPVEMSKLLKDTKVKYYPGYISNIENSKKYMDNNKLALNLGIYGVDFTYTKYYGKERESIEYQTVITEMASRLGIPNSTLSDLYTAMKEERDREKLIDLLSKTYATTDDYLKSQGKESTAVLIILGGWIEGLYLATNIYEQEDDNENMLARIVEQKFSLNTIIQLLGNYNNDKYIDRIYTNLLSLKYIYKKIKISYDENSVNIDSDKKVIIVSDTNPENNATSSQLAAIRDIVAAIRQDIVK